MTEKGLRAFIELVLRGSQRLQMYSMSLFTPTGFRIGLCQVGPCGVRRCDHLQRRPHPQLPLHRRPEGGVVGVARAGGLLWRGQEGQERMFFYFVESLF